MEAYGYVFKGYAGKIDPEYIPSLIGSPVGATAGSATDAYFERVEINNRRITDLSISRYCVFDNGPAGTSDVIFAIRGPIGSYYLPRRELEEIAAAHQDDDTIEMIAALVRKNPHVFG
jgi:hypothetical protein